MSERKVDEQILTQAVQKLGRKYDAVYTMISELQDNLQQVVYVARELLKQKDVKIAELQAPVKKTLEKESTK